MIDYKISTRTGGTNNGADTEEGRATLSFPRDPVSVSLRAVRDAAEPFDRLLFHHTFGEFHELARPIVIARVRAYLSQVSKSEAYEDLVQEVFLKISNPEKVLSYDPTRPAAAWINSISRNLTIDFSRRQRSRGRLQPFSSLQGKDPSKPDGFEALIEDHRVQEPLKSVIDEESHRRLRTIVDECLQEQQGRGEHLMGILEDDRTFRETALRVGIPEGTVKSRMFTFKGLLRTKLTQAGLAPEPKAK